MADGGAPGTGFAEGHLAAGQASESIGASLQPGPGPAWKGVRMNRNPPLIGAWSAALLRLGVAHAVTATSINRGVAQLAPFEKQVSAYPAHTNVSSPLRHREKPPQSMADWRDGRRSFCTGTEHGPQAGRRVAPLDAPRPGRRSGVAVGQARTGPLTAPCSTEEETSNVAR